MSTNTVATTNRFNTETLRGLTTFEEAAGIAQQMGAQTSADLFGDGFTEIDKEKLVGVELLILDWTFSESKDYEDREFAVIRVMTRDNRKLYFTDGGAGCFQQLKSVPAEAPHSIYVARGLRVSEYSYTDDKGKASKARTFYFDTSANR